MFTARMFHFLPWKAFIEYAVEEYMNNKGLTSITTYLECGEVLLHVSPAQHPHLVVRFVVMELHRIRISSDGLKEYTGSHWGFKG